MVLDTGLLVVEEEVLVMLAVVVLDLLVLVEDLVVFILVVVMVDILMEVDLLHIHQHRVMPEEQEIIIIPQKDMLEVAAAEVAVPDKLGNAHHQQTLQDLVDWVLNFQQHFKIRYQQ